MISFQEKDSVSLRLRECWRSKIFREEDTLRGLWDDVSKQVRARMVLVLTWHRRNDEEKNESKVWVPVGFPVSVSKKIIALFKMASC